MQQDATYISTQQAKARGSQWIVETVWTTSGPRWEPQEVRVRSAEGRAVRADTVRALPLGGLQQAVRIEAAAWRRTLAMAAAEGADVTGLFPGLPSTATVGPQRGRALTDADLQRVADVYRTAVRDGDGVTDAVRRAFSVSKSTAGKRIMRAREAGLLADIDKETL